MKEDTRSQLSPFLRPGFRENMWTLEEIRKALEEAGFRNLNPDILPLSVRLILGYGVREGALIDYGLGWDKVQVEDSEELSYEVSDDETPEDDTPDDMDGHLRHILVKIKELRGTHGDQMAPYLKKGTNPADQYASSQEEKRRLAASRLAAQYGTYAEDWVEEFGLDKKYYAHKTPEEVAMLPENVALREKRALYGQRLRELSQQYPVKSLPAPMQKGIDQLGDSIAKFCRRYIFDNSKISEAFQNPGLYPPFFVILHDEEEVPLPSYISQRLRCSDCGHLIKS